MKCTSKFEFFISHFILIIPPANKVSGLRLGSVGGRVLYRNHLSVHLFMQSCLVHILLMEKHLKFILQTRVAYGLAECVMILTKGHLDKSKVTGKKINVLWRIIEISYFAQRLIMAGGCVMNLTKVQFCKFKVIVKKRIIHV